MLICCETNVMRPVLPKLTGIWKRIPVIWWLDAVALALGYMEIVEETYHDDERVAREESAIYVRYEPNDERTMIALSVSQDL